MQLILSEVGVDIGVLQKYSANRRRNGSSSSLKTRPNVIESRYLPLFNQIPADDMMRLKTKYRLDLKVFGYDFDMNTLMASCNIESTDKTECC